MHRLMGRGGTLRWLVALAVLAGSLGLAACGDDDEGGSESTDEPIRIGASVPLTGQFSHPGEQVQRGYKVWEKLVNDSGGLLGRPVEVLIRDDASKQNLATANYNEFINQEDVDLLFGTFSSLLNLPASAVAERNQMLFVEPAGGSPDMFERGFQFLFFAQQAPAKEQAGRFSEWVLELPENERPSTAAYVSADLPFTTPVADGIQEQLEAGGIETLYDELYAPDTSNFDTIANGIKQAEPDVLVHSATSLPDGVGMIRSLVKVDFNPKALFQATTPNFGEQFEKGIGADNTEGIFSATAYTPSAGFTQNDEFLAAYKEMFGGEPEEDAAIAFGVGQITAAAVEGVGSLDSQEALADWLHENEVDTILGPLTWDEAGRPQSAYLLAQWQGGEELILAPPDVADTDEIVYPKPDWGSG